MTIKECEERLAYLAGRQGAMLCSRATVGLAVVLRALGLPKGSGVVVPVMVCANVVHAVRGAGLRPVFADVEAQRGGIGMDMGSGERVVGEGCQVLLAVPLFGGEVDGEALKEFAERHGLVVVEDAAQGGVRSSEFGVRNEMVGLGASKGAEGQGGGLGVCSVVSFGRGKVGDAGGGGAVFGDDLELLERVREDYRLRTAYSVGADCERIVRVVEGLGEEIEGRLRVARGYRERLWMEGVEHVGEVLPVWKYGVLARDKEVRDRVTRRLVERRVEATNLYPPLSAWFDGAEGEKYEGAWKIWRRIVNLPLRWDGDGEGEKRRLEVVEEVFVEVV